MDVVEGKSAGSAHSSDVGGAALSIIENYTCVQVTIVADCEFVAQETMLIENVAEV